jgi:hypothetical protein
MTGQCRRCDCHTHDLQMAGWCLACVGASVSAGISTRTETGLLATWRGAAVNTPCSLERLAAADAEDDRRVAAWRARR